MESQIAAARAWKDRTSRTFVKKGSTRPLIEVLVGIFIQLNFFYQFNYCIMNPWFLLRPNLMFRQSGILAACNGPLETMTALSEIGKLLFHIIFNLYFMFTVEPPYNGHL